MNKFIVRFSPLLYPTVGGFGKDSAGGQKLITDLCQAGRSHGNCALISNGSSAVLKPARTNMCCCAVMAVSIIIVWKVPKQMLVVFKKFSRVQELWKGIATT